MPLRMQPEPRIIKSSVNCKIVGMNWKFLIALTKKKHRINIFFILKTWKTKLAAFLGKMKFN